jgi:hypothetical protein
VAVWSKARNLFLRSDAGIVSSEFCSRNGCMFKFYPCLWFPVLVAALWRADPACKEAYQLCVSFRLIPRRDRTVSIVKGIRRFIQKLNNYCVYVIVLQPWFVLRKIKVTIGWCNVFSLWRSRLLSNAMFSSKVQKQGSVMGQTAKRNHRSQGGVPQ